MFEFMPQESAGRSDRHNAEFMVYENSIELPEIDLRVPREESDLKAQLEKAIKEENYERAAELRDLMKKEKEEQN